VFAWPVAAAGGGVVCPDEAPPRSCAAAARLRDIETGITIVIARMAAALSRTDLLL